MLEAPEITQTATQTIAVIHLTIPRADIGKVMGPGLKELREAVAAQGVEITGPWFTHHLRFAPDTWDFEIGVPVARAVEAAGRMQPSTRPSMRVAHATLRGGYELLGGAWGELSAWMRTQGVAGAEDIWEVYTTGPEASADPAGYHTDLYKPLLA